MVEPDKRQARQGANQISGVLRQASRVAARMRISSALDTYGGMAYTVLPIGRMNTPCPSATWCRRAEKPGSASATSNAQIMPRRREKRPPRKDATTTLFFLFY